MNKDIKQFIRENEVLFWGVKPEEKENISLNVLVETILNYGNEKRVKSLFDLIGVKTVAEIFFRQISGKRPNYHQRTKHFFRLYFKTEVSPKLCPVESGNHAQQSIHERFSREFVVCTANGIKIICQGGFGNDVPQI